MKDKDVRIVGNSGTGCPCLSTSEALHRDIMLCLETPFKKTASSGRYNKMTICSDIEEDVKMIE